MFRRGPGFRKFDPGWTGRNASDRVAPMEDRVQMWRTIRRLITVAAILGGLYFLVVQPVERALRSTKSTVERGLEQVLGAVTQRETRVVEGRAEVTGSSEISELSLLEMKMNATRTIEKAENFSVLPLGTKKLVVRGTFRVKGGYRLDEGVSLRVERGTVIARFPKPEVLSVELLDFDVLTEESGWLNKIQAADRAQILRELHDQMRRDAEASGLLDVADATLRTRLRDLLGTERVEVERELR